MVRHEPAFETAPAGAPAVDGPYVYRRSGAHAAQTRDGAHDDAYDDGYEDHYYDDDEPHGLVDRVLAAPGKLAITTVALVAFAIVGVNAAFMQPGAHPAPMLSTRAEAPAQPLPQQTALQSQRAITMAPAPIVPPSRTYDATASIAQPAQPAAEALEVSTGPRFVAPSPMPRPNFGAPSQVAAVAPVAPAAPVQQAPAPRPVETIAVTDPIGALLAPVVEQVLSASQPTDLSQPAAATRSAQPLVQAVQAILAEMGYAPGTIDGVVGPSTEEAIRRFQLSRALEPNGQITTDLLQEIERVTGTRITSS